MTILVAPLEVGVEGRPTEWEISWFHIMWRGEERKKNRKWIWRRVDWFNHEKMGEKRITNQLNEEYNARIRKKKVYINIFKLAMFQSILYPSWRTSIGQWSIQSVFAQGFEHEKSLDHMILYVYHMRRTSLVQRWLRPFGNGATMGWLLGGGGWSVGYLFGLVKLIVIVIIKHDLFVMKGLFISW